MPTYAYKCDKCGTKFEMKQSINDSAITKCPSEICPSSEKGQGNVHRIISANVGLVFKGSGFYLTDYNKSGNKASSTPQKTETPTNSETTTSTNKTDAA